MQKYGVKKIAKVTIVGTGGVGCQTAFCTGLKNMTDIVLIDIVEGLPQGKALDIQQAMALAGSDTKITGTNDYAKTKDSDIIVVTAGFPRKPGMTRDDLRDTNSKIVKTVVEQTVKHSPNAILIVVTNPLDVMVDIAYKASGFPKHRVIGMAGVLDSARFKSFLSLETGASVRDIETVVLGNHGDTMVPLARYCKIKGKPITELMTPERINAVIERTRNGGGEIIGHLKTGSTAIAPAMSIMTMIESILLDQKKILPCSVLLDGEYGARDIFIGVPTILGKAGVEGVVELELSSSERAAFERSVAHINGLVAKNLN